MTDRTYLVYGVPFYHSDHHRRPKVHTKADLSILRTCKAIKEEASQVLLSKAVFRFAVDIDYAKDPPLPPPKALTDRMMNVDFNLNQASFDDDRRNHFGPPNDLKPLTKTTLGRFTGSNIRRRTCGILLWAIEYHDGMNRFLSSPMALAMEAMTGFDQVIIEVEDQNVSLADSWAEAEKDRYGSESSSAGADDLDNVNEEANSEKEGNPITESRITVCVGMFSDQIRKAMAPTLGPHEEWATANEPGVATSLCTCFLPWKYRNKISGEAHKQKLQGKSQDNQDEQGTRNMVE